MCVCVYTTRKFTLRTRQEKSFFWVTKPVVQRRSANMCNTCTMRNTFFIPANFKLPPFLLSRIVFNSVSYDGSPFLFSSTLSVGHLLLPNVQILNLEKMIDTFDFNLFDFPIDSLSACTPDRTNVSSDFHWPLS